MKKKELLARIQRLEQRVAALEPTTTLSVPTVWYPNVIGNDIAKATTLTTWPPNSVTPLGGNQ